MDNRFCPQRASSLVFRHLLVFYIYLPLQFFISFPIQCSGIHYMNYSFFEILCMHLRNFMIDTTYVE